MNKMYTGFFGPHPQLAIPESFDLCFSYEEQVAYLASKVKELEEKVEKLEENVLTN